MINVILSLFGLRSSVPESDFSQLVSAHEPTLVHVAIDAVQPSFSRVLPHLEVAPVFQHRSAFGVLGYHELVVVEFAEEIVVVKVGSGIDEGLLLVGFLHEVQEFEQRVAEFFRIHAALGLHVYHGQQVLVGGSALCHEVGELGLLRNTCPVEVVRAHFESVSVCQVYVLLVFAVYIGAAFCGFEIDVCHLGVVAHCFPEHIALVVAEVDAVYVLACVLALYLGMDVGGYNGDE